MALTLQNGRLAVASHVQCVCFLERPFVNLIHIKSNFAGMASMVFLVSPGGNSTRMSR
jgi:hypothetical protein